MTCTHGRWFGVGISLTPTCFTTSLDGVRIQ